ncbi:MAG TPA: hypothetical protein VK028_08730, partial [Micromonosporaceae bacterium]|nr:hypothetical protein [Micromonosporaceae bacterium]
MQSSKAFFSFTAVPNPADHRAYNEWHQLDHQPENLALPGVLHGQRWVRTPSCATVGHAEDALADLHYLNMYWFREPVTESFREWQELAARSFQLGRRVDIRIARRLLMGSFTPVRGYASPRVRVGAGVLPYRPNTGVGISVTRVEDPRGVDTHDAFDRFDHDHAPALVLQPGVAGLWTFASQSTTADKGWSPRPGSTTFDEQAEAVPGSIRLVLVYLDEP